MRLSKSHSADPGSRPKTLWNISFISILVLGFITGSAGQMVNPILSKYVISLGGTISLAGTIFGLNSGIALLIHPFSGAASDIINKKFVLIGSVLISAAAYIGYLLFNSITAVIICRIMQGFSFAFMSVARIAFATDFIPRGRLGEGVAFTSFGIVLSQAVGPIIGLWVVEKWGFSHCFAVAIILSLIGAGMLCLLPYKRVKKKLEIKKLRLNNLVAVEILPYAFLAGMFALLTHMANSFLALLGEDRGIANVGLFFTVYAITALVVRPFSGRVLDKFGLPVLLYPAFFIASLTMLLLGFAQSLSVIMLAGFFKAFSQGIAMPSITGSSIKRLGRERAGVVSATIHFGQDLVCMIGPPVGGAIAAASGYTTMYYSFAAFILGVGLPLYMYLRHRDKKLKNALSS